MEADVEDSWYAIARDADLDEVLSRAALDERDLSAWARDRMATAGVPRNDAIHRSRLNQTFAYQILAGTRHASRDKLLQLAFGMQLGIRDASELLERGVRAACGPTVAGTSSLRTPSITAWASSSATTLLGSTASGPSCRESPVATTVRKTAHSDLAAS
jgi:hypothetical protein